MHRQIKITRAEYEAALGLKADPYSIGACVYGPDAKSIIVEYLFVDAEQPDLDTEWRRAQRERAQPVIDLTEPDRRFLAALKIGL